MRNTNTGHQKIEGKYIWFGNLERMNNMVSIKMDTAYYILSISSPTASSSNATGKLYQIHLEMEGRAPGLRALAGHACCPTWNPGTYSNGS